LATEQSDADASAALSTPLDRRSRSHERVGGLRFRRWPWRRYLPQTTVSKDFLDHRILFFLNERYYSHSPPALRALQRAHFVHALDPATPKSCGIFGATVYRVRPRRARVTLWASSSRALPVSCWNTRVMLKLVSDDIEAFILAQLDKCGLGHNVLSLLGWKHINLTGDYVWNSSKKLKKGFFRPLRQLSNL
jgi:hypothetical protein